MSRKSLVPIQLPANPTQPLEAATKQYVDAIGAGGAVPTVNAETGNVHTPRAFANKAALDAWTTARSGTVAITQDNGQQYHWSSTGSAWVYTVNGSVDRTWQRVTRSGSAQLLTVGSSVIVKYDTLFSGVAGLFNLTAGAEQGRYTCPVSGIYRVEARTQLQVTAAGERFQLNLHYDGSEHTRGTDKTVVSPGGDDLQLATTLGVATGTKLDLRVLQVNGTARNLEHSITSCTWCTIYRVN